MFALKGPTNPWVFFLTQSSISESRRVVIFLAVKIWLAFLNKVFTEKKNLGWRQ